jgi:hypothetical protein
MKRLICILASAALLGACEQKTETITHSPPTDGAVTVPTPPDKSETGQKVKKTESTTTTTTSSPNP